MVTGWKNLVRLCFPIPAAMLTAILALIFATSAFGQDIVPDTIKQRVAACFACHGKEGRAASDGFYPRIAGKPAGYLFNQLINFQTGRRSYPLMQYMVDHQSDAYLLEIARYFSDQHLPYPAPQVSRVSEAILARGQTLVFFGNSSRDASRYVPACVACHGQALTGTLPAIPGLLGLPQDYLNAQFGAWKSGNRRAAPPDCMAQIADRLTDGDISAAVAWLSAQAVPDQGPAPLVGKLPIPCGSMPQ